MFQHTRYTIRRLENSVCILPVMLCRRTFWKFSTFKICGTVPEDRSNRTELSLVRPATKYVSKTLFIAAAYSQRALCLLHSILSPFRPLCTLQSHTHTQASSLLPIETCWAVQIIPFRRTSHFMLSILQFFTHPMKHLAFHKDCFCSRVWPHV